jgi:predicted  nucleic acid-binding Zn-ribbon protein
MKKYLFAFICLFHSTRDHELQLLQNAKKFQTNLDRQKTELEKADNFPESSNSEVSKYREELLKHHNELAQADERQYQYEYKLEWYVID